MEHDCDQFDDPELRLDALLSRARWPSVDLQAVERLKTQITAREAVVEKAPEIGRGLEPQTLAVKALDKAPEIPVVQPEIETRAIVEAPPVSIVETPPAASKHPVAPPVRIEPRIPRRAVGFFIGMAACLLLAVGIAWLFVQQSRQMRPRTPVAAAPELPGRAPTVLEAWYISNSARNDRPPQRQPAPVDPKLARLARLRESGDARSLAAVWSNESDVFARQQLIDAMLARHDGVDRMLDLIMNAKTRAQILADLRAMPTPPTGALLAQLDHPVVARRFAAAKALGTLCHGSMLPELDRMIHTTRYRRQALAVLSECRDEQAVAYVRQLQKNASLASEYRIIRQEMNQLF